MKDFEEKLTRLEQIADRIRDGAVPLHEAADLFEEGMKLSRQLERGLRKLEQRIEILVNDPQSEEEPPILELFPDLDRSKNDDRRDNSDDV